MTTILERQFPGIDWRTPLTVHWPARTTFACRICIANYGLNAKSEHQFDSIHAAEDHITKEHSE